MSYRSLHAHVSDPCFWYTGLLHKLKIFSLPCFFLSPHPTLLSSYSCSFLFVYVSDASQLFCCRYLTDLVIYTTAVFHLSTCSLSALIYPVYVHLNWCIASHLCRRVLCVICFCLVQAVDKFSITLLKNNWELLYVHHYWSFDSTKWIRSIIDGHFYLCFIY